MCKIGTVQTTNRSEDTFDYTQYAFVLERCGNKSCENDSEEIKRKLEQDELLRREELDDERQSIREDRMFL